MISFGDYRLQEMFLLFSPGNADGHMPDEDGCPAEEHQHMSLAFVHKNHKEPDIILALDHNKQTEEWTVNRDVTLQMNAQAQAAHVAHNLETLFGVKAGVATSPPPTPSRDEDEDERPYPGMYL